MHETDLLYKIALGLIPGIGDINARKLVSYTGSVEAVFREPYSSIIKIPGIGETLAHAIVDKSYMKEAESECGFVTAKKIKVLFYLDDDYPNNLKECEDSPVTLYFRGNANLHSQRMLSVVGTRKSTPRGRDICENIIAQLAGLFPELIIVSGLAYGIDITAHRAALNAGVHTLGVLAHGMKTIYPPGHTQVAREMVSQGGLITDFVSDAPAERNNFLKRNRIIAGLPAALLVVESGVKGGAMVTAEMAFSYNRDVMAIPGRPSDNWSAGCNRLIKRNIAGLVENANDICQLLNWESKGDNEPVQAQIFNDLDETERIILNLLEREDVLSADQVSVVTGLPVNRLATKLLSLEMKGAVRSYPGNIYGKV